MWFKRFLCCVRTEIRNTAGGAPYALSCFFLAIEGIREMRESE